MVQRNTVVCQLSRLVVWDKLLLWLNEKDNQHRQGIITSPVIISPFNFVDLIQCFRHSALIKSVPTKAIQSGWIGKRSQFIIPGLLDTGGTMILTCSNEPPLTHRPTLTPADIKITYCIFTFIYCNCPGHMSVYLSLFAICRLKPFWKKGAGAQVQSQQLKTKSCKT